jgi:hypothetical protein
MDLMKLGVLLLVSLGIGGCAVASDSKSTPTGPSGEAQSAQDSGSDAASGGTATVDQTDAESGGTATVDQTDAESELYSRIQAAQIDGVWVFEYDDPTGAGAGFTGKASIADGCLFVGPFILVWPAEQLDDARLTIAAIRAGELPELSVGGYDISPASAAESGEPLSIPSVIAEHCSTDSVWFASAVSEL